MEVGERRGWMDGWVDGWVGARTGVVEDGGKVGCRLPPHSRGTANHHKNGMDGNVGWPFTLVLQHHPSNPIPPFLHPRLHFSDPCRRLLLLRPRPMLRTWGQYQEPIETNEKRATQYLHDCGTKGWRNLALPTRKVKTVL